MLSAVIKVNFEQLIVSINRLIAKKGKRKKTKLDG